MKASSSLVVVLSFCSAAFAQLSTPPLASQGPLAATIANNRIAAPGQTTVMLSGKVVSEDNNPPHEPGNIILQCANEIRGRAEIDPKGNFTVPVATSEPSAKRDQGPSLPVPQWMGCELIADVPGFRSDHLRLQESPQMGVVNVGTIIVHPVAVADPTFTVSVTSLQAPEKAKKAFQKGQDQLRKGRWAAACQYFERAIAAYPRYAMAWLELGRSEVRQNSFRDAEQSFQQAIRQDSHLLDGYVELSRLAVQQQNWKELADVTSRLLQLSPDAGAQFWFLNSAANFNLSQMKEAETALTRGMRLDPKHQFPQMEYLYGLILASKKDYGAAAEHIRAFLRLSPSGHEADRARATLSQLTKLTAENTSKLP